MNQEKQISECDKSLLEGSLTEQPQMNPHPIPIEVLANQPPLSSAIVPTEKNLTNLPPCIVPTEKNLTNHPPCIVPTEKYCIETYEADEEKNLEMKNVDRYFQIDNNYTYANSSDNKTILIYSLESLQLIKTLPKPNGIDLYYLHILNVGKRFYIFGSVFNSDIVLTFDEKGVKLHDSKLPSEIHDFSKGEAGKVFIECRRHVILYDAVTNQQESIIDDVIYPMYCCSLGGGEYCMEVMIEEEFELVKVVNGEIVKVLNDLVYCLSSNSSRMICGTDGNKIHLMDRNMDGIFTFGRDFSGDLLRLNINDGGNIHVLSRVCHQNKNDKYYVKKYKMIFK